MTRVRSGAAAAHRHAVQFYDGDDQLFGAASTFLAGGLAAGEPAVIIATEAHRDGFSRRLASRFDLPRLRADGTVTFLDARETLDTIMSGGMPDERLFRESVGDVIARATARRSVRAYGEMVDLLFKDGCVDAALRLEELWNDLAESHAFTLLCAYCLGSFNEESHAEAFEAVCAQHAEVRPVERAVGLDAQRLEIGRLQQRSLALETEVTRRKELESALRTALAEQGRVEGERERLLVSESAARESSEAANLIKEEFLAILSHELRTPLNAIVGWAHVAADPRSDAETLRRAIGIIQRNAAQQMHLVDDMLDVSRIVTGKLQVAIDSVDMAAVLVAAADGVRLAATAKDVRLEVDVDPSARFVTGDAARLQQVVWNLLANAIRFAPHHGRVRLSLERHADCARIVVHDDGPGIAPDFLPHVFERFRQAESGTTRRHGGLGLGLAVVRHLAEAHGGTATAESPGEGRGATFTVELPLRHAGPVASGAAPSILRD